MAMERENRAPRGAGRKRKKVCQFCVDKCEHIDYKDAAKLRRFISERSKILPRRTTAECRVCSECTIPCARNCYFLFLCVLGFSSALSQLARCLFDIAASERGNCNRR